MVVDAVTGKYCESFNALADGMSLRMCHAQQAQQSGQKEIPEKSQLQRDFAQAKNQVHEAQTHAHQPDILNMDIGMLP